MDIDFFGLNILILAGFDEKSDRVIKNISKVAVEIARRYGIIYNVYIEQYWNHNHQLLGLIKLPQVYVNGKPIPVKKTLNEEELIRILLSEARENEF